MPNYQFLCENCNYTEEARLLISKRNNIRNCPKCGNILTRLIGSGSGIIFKGKGFYQTDYGGKNPD